LHLGATTLAIQSKRNTPKFGWSRGWVAVLSRKPAISLKWSKIGPRLLLMPDRKLHACFQLVPKSMTLNGHFALCFKIHAFSEPTTKIWMKIDPHYRQQRCCTVTLVVGSIRFMWIFAGVPWRWGIKREWGNRKCRFSGLSDAVFGTLGNEANIII